MALFRTAIELLDRLPFWRNAPETADLHETHRARRICRVESMEPRQLLAADIQVGAVYIEEDVGSDISGDTFEITFEGGAPGTQLTRVVIDGDRNSNGLFDEGDVFFDLVDSGVGLPGSRPFGIVATGAVGEVTLTNVDVFDGSTQIVLTFDGFEAGEKFVFSLDVDEVNDFTGSITDVTSIDPATAAVVNEGVDTITSGVEFQRSRLHVQFTAPHFHELSDSAEFRNRYDTILSGRGLNLSPDNVDGKENRTAGAATSLMQQPLPVTIAGRVFLDNNLDLRQDAGEVGLAGVQISLWRLEEALYAATGHVTTTDASGDYRFGEDLNLPPATYQIRETQPSSFGGKPLFSVGAVNGTVDGAVVGRTLAGNHDVLSEVEIPLGDQHAIHYNFAEAQAADISGYVYHDRDDNGLRDSNNEGIAGVTVRIEPVSTIAPTSSATLVTDSLGFFRFSGLPPGRYHVAEVDQPSGWLDGQDTAGEVDGQTQGTALSNRDRIEGVVLAGGSSGVEYNFGELRPVEIHGSVHLSSEDGDCFGVEVTHEPLAGVQILLLSEQGITLAETTTDELGDYRFSGLRPGNFTVVEVTPDGLFDGGERAGAVEGSPRGVVSNDVIAGIVLHSGEIAVNYDFCENRPASISGFVHHDADNDGVRDAGESPISGVNVVLRDAQGATVGGPQITDAGGRYEFTALPAGRYSVHELQPSEWLDGLDTAGTIDGNGVGVAINPGDEIRQVDVGWGQSGVDFNFGELLPVEIHGSVHLSTEEGDCFGIDVSHKPLAGVRVLLLDEAGNPLAEATTDQQGNYEFTGLRPGTYGLLEVTPKGLIDGDEHIGIVQGDPRGSVIDNDLIAGIVLTSGEVAANYDFCEHRLSSLSGFVYHDENNDGVFQSSEAPIAGVQISLVDVDTLVVLGTQTTAADGLYRFTNLHAGNYRIVESQPTGWLDGLDAAGTIDGAVVGLAESSGDTIDHVSLGWGQNGINYNFGELRPVEIHGKVHLSFGDDDCFGESATHEPLAGVSVMLQDAVGSIVVQTTTDRSGAYAFTGLAPGEYTVVEVTPAGLFDGSEQIGTVGGAAVGAVSGNDTIGQIVLGSGEVAVNYDFCEHVGAELSGFVYHDANNDGLRQSGESPIPNVVVQLFMDRTNQLVDVQQTDTNGFYRFTNLPAGSYQLLETHPSDWIDGRDTAGTVDGVPVGVASNPGDRIGEVTLTWGDMGFDYNFGELLPAAISGTVFQDGPTIQTTDGSVPEDIVRQRGGRRSADDLPIAGVTLRLTNFAGEPILDAQGRPRIAITDRHGFYEFRGLAPGSYAVFEVHPDVYIDGLDTAGSTGGIAVNPGAAISPAFLSVLSVDPANDAILRIPLPAGANSTGNDFSEILIEPLNPPVSEPPSTPLAPLPPLTPIFVPRVPRLAFPRPVIVSPGILLDRGGDVGGYTWHLSVIDAGQPRNMRRSSRVIFRNTGVQLDVAAWSHVSVDGSQWTLADREGRVLKRSRFGRRHGTAVVGDFNGDGISELGVFLDGQWFIDLNGNGVWDAADLWAKLGHDGDLPTTGDWDGDGKTDIAVFGPAWPGDPRAIAAEPGLPDVANKPTVAMKNLPPAAEDATLGRRQLKLTSTGPLRTDVIDHVFHFGTAADVPVTGDWNGDGVKTIGVYRAGTWHLDVDGNGRWSSADVVTQFGNSRAVPVVGDWDGNGVDQLGVYENGHWTLDSNSDRRIDAADQVFTLGGPHHQPVVGDWDGDGAEEVGVFRDGGSGDND